MKKILFYSYLFILASLFYMPVSAENSSCSNEEIIRLSKIAYNVNADWEAVKYRYPDDESANSADERESEVIDTYYRMHVNIENVTDELSIQVDNVTENKKYTFGYGDTDKGSLALDAGRPIEIRNINIIIYGTGLCSTEKLRTISMTLPKFNLMSNYDICNEIPDYYMCQTFVVNDYDMTEMEFKEKAEKEIKKREEEDKNIPIVDFFAKNWKTILIVVVIVGIGGAVTTVIVVRNRRRRLV